MNKIAKCIAASLVSVWVFASGISAEAAMSKGQVTASIEKDYDAKVLTISSGKDAGRAVFFVRVMYNGGNFNTAFQVNTLVIDAGTGERVKQFRHGPSGRQMSGNFDSSPNRQAPNALRGHIWR